MIRKLQIKFISVIMGFLLIVFSVVMLTLNLYMQKINARQTDVILKTVAEQDGLSFLAKRRLTLKETPAGWRVSPFLDARVIFARIFYVKMDHRQRILDVDYDMMFHFTREEAVSYAETVLKSGKRAGSFENYRYLVAEKEYGSIAVFVENSREMRILRQLTYTSTTVTGVTCVVLLGFSLLLSRWMAKPVKDAFERQKRFISDAGHELKTPLTIISANTDVLENEIGENIRLAYIREQSERMNRLITDLASLARSDESQSPPVMTEFDLSQAVLSTVLAFESRAFEEKKAFHYDIREGLSQVGDEQQLKQVVTILTDNAIKHSGHGDAISVTLTTEKEKKVLSVHNTGAGVPASERERIFERFYRSDASRSRQTGGYGLGLAIADSIVKMHKGKISVTGKDGEWVRFTVTLTG